MYCELNAETPIYIQLAEHVRADILAGKYTGGQRIPSVREFAAQAAVNPNTMQKALTVLEDWGIVTVQSTAGRFVSTSPEILAKAREDVAATLTNNYLLKLKSIAYTEEETVEMLKKVMKEVR